MQSSRKPRRVFTAPLVLTVAALPAACFVAADPQPKPPATRDHRGTDTTVRDNRDGTPETPPPVIANPPPVDTTTQTDPPPVPPEEPPPTTTEEAPTYPRSWTVSLAADGTCSAYLHVDCKKGRTCNPPPPRATKCPDGITMDRPIKIHAAAGSNTCFIEPPAAKCPEKATCNPPPPKQIACP